MTDNITFTRSDKPLTVTGKEKPSAKGPLGCADVEGRDCLVETVVDGKLTKVPAKEYPADVNGIPHTHRIYQGAEISPSKVYGTKVFDSPPFAKKYVDNRKTS